MVCANDIMAELGVLWDIHTSPIQDQVSVIFPLIRLKGACSKFSECLDYCIVIVHTSSDALYQLIASAVHYGGLCITDFEHIGGEWGDVAIVILALWVMRPSWQVIHFDQ